MNSDINLLLLFLFFVTILLINYWAAINETKSYYSEPICYTFVPLIGGEVHPLLSFPV